MKRKLYHNKGKPIVLGKNAAKRKLKDLAKEFGAKKLTKKVKRKIKQLTKEFNEEKSTLRDDIPQLV